jgi:hypothetical protein
LRQQPSHNQTQADTNGKISIVRCSPLAPNSSSQKGRTEKKARHQNNASSNSVVCHSTQLRGTAIGGQPSRNQTSVEITVVSQRRHPGDQLTIAAANGAKVHPTAAGQLLAQPSDGVRFLLLTN